MDPWPYLRVHAHACRNHRRITVTLVREYCHEVMKIDEIIDYRVHRVCTLLLYKRWFHP